MSRRNYSLSLKEKWRKVGDEGKERVEGVEEGRGRERVGNERERYE